MSEYNLAEELQRDFKLNENQTEFVLRVASGKKPIDVVKEVYNYSHETNAYAQLRKLIGNPKIDEAFKHIGFNLKDRMDKNAFAIIRAFEEIAFSASTPDQARLTALKELAKYNPILNDLAERQADESEEQELRKRLEKYANDTKPSN